MLDAVHWENVGADEKRTRGANLREGEAPGAGIQNKTAPRFREGPFTLLPAATYSPTQSPVQYHRRWRA
jgi:hypothetical protein